MLQIFSRSPSTFFSLRSPVPSRAAGHLFMSRFLSPASASGLGAGVEMSRFLYSPWRRWWKDRISYPHFATVNVLVRRTTWERSALTALMKRAARDSVAADGIVHLIREHPDVLGWRVHSQERMRRLPEGELRMIIDAWSRPGSRMDSGSLMTTYAQKFLHPIAEGDGQAIDAASPTLLGAAYDELQPGGLLHRSFPSTHVQRAGALQWEIFRKNARQHLSVELSPSSLVRESNPRLPATQKTG